jgi:hypothetical protein
MPKEKKYACPEQPADVKCGPYFPSDNGRKSSSVTVPPPTPPGLLGTDSASGVWNALMPGGHPH